MKPLLAALLLAFSPLAAQAAGPVTPDAGSILQQVKPVTPPAPSSTGTGLTIEQEGGAKLPPSAPFPVKAFRITGNQKIDTATLHALVADGEGKTLTLDQLQDLAARITDYYHDHGYPLARAIIPAQTIREGVVVIEVIEARYGKIRLDNRSRVNTPLLESTLSPLHSGDVIAQAEMDRALLLLSDIPGVVVNATLKPGEAVGTSDLLVNGTSGPALSGSVTLDNYGSRYTGRARIGGTVNFIDPLHHGDVLSLTALSSGGDLNYGRIGYEFLLNGKGTRLGGSYSALRYILGGPLSSLDSNGSAEVESVWATHPLIRRQDVNLYGKLGYDQLRLRDHIDSTGLRTDRSLGNWTISLAGDARDALLSSSGITSWNVAWTSGHVGFDDAAAQLSDAATANTQGGFSKWNANLARLQRLSPKSILYLFFSGQWANDNLDSSQKMIAGGPYTVRAYDMGAISGDEGYLGTAEFRHDLGAWHGQWQAVAFVDSAHIIVNKTAWVAGANSATLTGAGVGLNWSGANQWAVRAYLATRLGSTPVLVADTASTRGWIEIGRSF
jgi:hemolysin activation/secretion protein